MSSTCTTNDAILVGSIELVSATLIQWIGVATVSYTTRDAASSSIEIFSVVRTCAESFVLLGLDRPGDSKKKVTRKRPDKA